MTEEQWKAAWILCETAGEMDADSRDEYILGATVDPDVGQQVLLVLEEFSTGPQYAPAVRRHSGDVVGRYVLLELLGRGGMGEVYSARDQELDRSVALKFLPADLPLEHAASQVIREGRVASSLNHPNIVTIHEILQGEWGLSIVMELVEGRSLRSLRNAGPLPEQDVIRIGRQIASALAAAHSKGIVHRDIKPENIMVRSDGLVKVLDFGLAQRIREDAISGQVKGLPVGTVRYMPPEQKAGLPVTRASDVYALALILEELGGWRHPLLTQMRNVAPEQRPNAEKVASQLERLESSGHWRVPIAGAGVFLAILGSFLALHFSNGKLAPSDFRFEQLTSYQTGHDVTVARISPDGERLAYATVDGGLIVRDNRTSTVHELVAPPDLAIGQLLFPSDANLLAVGLKGGVFEAWTVPLKGGAASRLLSDSQLLALTHDGRRVAWLNDTHEIWTASLNGGGARLLYRGRPNDRIASLFWSANDKILWFNRLRRCSSAISLSDISINSDTCEESVLASQALDTTLSLPKAKPIRLNSAFFADDGELFFLRENVDRISSSGFNLWSLQTNKETDDFSGAAHQLSSLNGVVLSQLTGSRDGRRLAVVRTDSTTQTYVADWQITPSPTLRNPHRVTFEQNNSYPHAWTPDGQSIIFESDRNGHIELFRQNVKRRGAELLVSTQGDVYMPQVTPDGKWLLMMSRDLISPGKPDELSRHRLLRAPIAGGHPVEVFLGQPLDEFRCSLPGRGTGCVLRTTQADGQRYFELDPVRGVGRELGHTAFVSVGLGRWSLSPDGTQIVVPDTHNAGRFLEVHLDQIPSRRSQTWHQIDGIGRLSSISFVSFGEGWLASSPMLNATVNMAFGDLFRAEGLFFIDARLHPHLISRSATNIFGMVSPNGKQMALLGADVTSNVWTFQRTSLADSAQPR